MEAQLDRFPVRDLGDRYKGSQGQPIQKSAIYDRLNALGLKPEKTTKGSFVNADQLTELDELHSFIQAGGKIANFKVHRKSTGRTPNNQIDDGSSLSTASEIASPSQTTIAIAQSLQTIADRLLILQDPLEQQLVQREMLRMLDEAAKKRWLLTTSMLLSWLGRRSLPRCHDGKFEFYGFVFVKTGMVGRQIQWGIVKEQ